MKWLMRRPATMMVTTVAAIIGVHCWYPDYQQVALGGLIIFVIVVGLSGYFIKRPT